jgi:N-acetyl-anhydromuramyl-L-alanine amidase AmpD
MPVAAGWNSLVDPANRFTSPNLNARKGAGKPTHIVIHVTGSNDLASVKKTFAKPQSVSSHYLVTKDGTLIQFVPDAMRAYHAGIETSVRKLYQAGLPVWTKYLRYFDWYKGYPKDAVYLDGDLHPVWSRTESVFVIRRDGQPWQEYQYFISRWPGRDLPVNFDVDPDANNYTIGIETLGHGAKTSDPAVYTSAMYSALKRLVIDLSAKHAIPMTKGRVVGHEDVNPIARFGWDPAAGFDWSQVHE